MGKFKCQTQPQQLRRRTTRPAKNLLEHLFFACWCDGRASSSRQSFTAEWPVSSSELKRAVLLLPTQGTSHTHITRKLSCLPACSFFGPPKKSLSLAGHHSRPRRTRPRRLHSDERWSHVVSGRHNHGEGGGQCENVLKGKVRRACNPRQSTRESLTSEALSHPAGWR